MGDDVFELALKPKELAGKIDELRSKVKFLTAKPDRTLHEEAVLTFLTTLFTSVVPEGKVTIEGDSIKMEPENGVTLTANYYFFFEKRGDKYVLSSSSNALKRGHSIVNARFAGRVEDWNVVTLPGATLKTNFNIKDYNRIFQFLEKVAEKTDDSRVLITVDKKGNDAIITAMSNTSAITFLMRDGGIDTMYSVGDTESVSNLIIAYSDLFEFDKKQLIVSMAEDVRSLRKDGIMVL